MRWLLIGGAGLVGSALRRVLGTREVIVTVHRAQAPGAVPLDLEDPESAAAIVRRSRPDVILLAAAEAWVERCEREPEATRRVNVEAPRRIAEAAPAARLVVFSSEYVFDGTRGVYREDDPVSPINEYGRQKVALEALARERAAHLVCRTSGVYGWSPARTSFVAQVVDRLRRGERFTVPDDQLITPTPALELAHAVVTLVERGTTGTVHVAGPEILARLEFARRIAVGFGLDATLLVGAPTATLGLSADRPRRAGLDTSRLVALQGAPLTRTERALATLRETEPTL